VLSIFYPSLSFSFSLVRMKKRSYSGFSEEEEAVWMITERTEETFGLAKSSRV
jgi:hypothetical protein